MPCILVSSWTERVNPSTITKNNSGERGQPWAVPCVIRNGSLRWPFAMMRLLGQLLSSYSSSQVAPRTSIKSFFEIKKH
eukprot:5164729-Pleurochrysis_carterae.AAC.1